MEKLKSYKIIFFIFCFFLASCAQTNSYNISGNAFGTIYYININTKKDIDINSIKENINHIINSINNAASNYTNESEISRFNQSSSKSFLVNHSLLLI